MTILTVPLVGAFFRPPAASLLKVLPAGVRLELLREPSNQYDPNAIAVLCSTASIPEARHGELEDLLASQGRELKEVLEQGLWHLGYVPRQEAARLSQAKLGEARLAFAADGKPQVKLTIEGA